MALADDAHTTLVLAQKVIDDLIGPGPHYIALIDNDGREVTDRRPASEQTEFTVPDEMYVSLAFFASKDADSHIGTILSAHLLPNDCVRYVPPPPGAPHFLAM